MEGSAPLAYMEYINIRKFVREIKKVEDRLPVTVTRYGKPIFIVEKIPTDSSGGREHGEEDTGEPVWING